MAASAASGLGTTALRHPLAIKKVVMQFGNDRVSDDKRDEVFEVFARYELGDPIARGTFGFVVEATDTDAPEGGDDGGPLRVAIKKIPHLFDHGVSRLWLCAARELQMMRHFDHPNVMSAEDIFIPLGDHNNLTLHGIMERKENFEEVYIVMKLMSSSLRGLLDQQEEVAATVPADAASAPAATSSRGDGTESAAGGCEKSGGGGGDGRAGSAGGASAGRRPLQLNERAYLLFQLLLGMGYLHRCGVMHRDLKPENVLVDVNWTARICDFGQGRGVAGVSTVDTLVDNCTQWYAAPETLTLRAGELSTATMDEAVFHSADVWSLGCIAAEMLIGAPLFEAKRSGGLEQLCAIMEVMGRPTAEELAAVTRSESDKAEYEALVGRRGSTLPERSRLREMLVCPLGPDHCSEEEVELVMLMLQYDPRRRITIRDALVLPFFADFTECDDFRPVLASALDMQTAMFPVIQKSEIATVTQGREFIWRLFAERHPEVQELIAALEEAEVRKTAGSGSFPPDGGAVAKGGADAGGRVTA